jgi:molecular chaperone DnaK
MRIDRAIGLDLGTTNSEVAWLAPDDRTLRLYADKYGRSVIPSAVAWDSKRSEFVVGHGARALRNGDEAPIESIKRKMGQAVRVKVGVAEHLPEEISAKIVAELADCMRQFLSQKVGLAASAMTELTITRVVITVPAYFDAPQVEATRRAGELAGLQVIGILQEPTAAAMYHAWKTPELAVDGFTLVYDLGGGTFDVSVLRRIAGEYQVLAIDGDNYLGGDDFDRRFAETLRADLQAQGYALNLDVANSATDRRIFQRLVHLAQEIKEQLSSVHVANIAKSDFMHDQNGEPVSYLNEVARERYEACIADLVESTITCAERAVRDAAAQLGMDALRLDHVLLVGGSTRVPLVRRLVAQRLAAGATNTEPLAAEVDTCVALGAALHAATLGGLVLDDKVQSTRVRLRGPLASAAPQFSLKLTLEAVPAQAHSIAIWAGDDLIGEAQIHGDIPADLAIAMVVPENAETQATLAVQSAFGSPLAELPLRIYCGAIQPRAGALTRAAVTAKDLGIEVLRAGKRDRRVLMPKGTGLPAQVSRVLFTVDQSGTLVLRLLQNRLPIKTLVLEIPALPVGSPIELVLSCDEAMRITARAEVGNVHVTASIEASLSDIGEESTDALLAEAEKAGHQVWGEQGEQFRRESERLTALLREAVRIDPDKVRSVTHRLRDLLERHRGDGFSNLTPPLRVFEETVGQLRVTVYSAKGTLIGLSRQEWEAKLDALDARGRDAFDRSDAGAWRRINAEAQALLETARVESWQMVSLDDAGFMQRRLLAAEALQMELTSRLHALSGAADSALGDARTREASKLRAWLQDTEARIALTRRNPSEASVMDRQGVISELRQELERIEVAVDRLPSMGLPTDRGSEDT